MTGILSFMHLAVSQFFFDKLIPCNKVNQSKLMESLEQKKTILLIFYLRMSNWNWFACYLLIILYKGKRPFHLEIWSRWYVMNDQNMMKST